jgi:uncharacterized lipoprotein YddW (UPF0748 family)
VALLASCDGKDGPVSPAAAPEVNRKGPDVRASRADAVMMVRTPSAERGARGGTTLQLDAAVFNPRGHELEHKKHIYWTSSDTVVATVDAAGLVTAQDTGEVAIVVDHKKGVDTVRVLVVPVPVAAVTIEGADSVSLGDTTSYVATPRDSVGEPLEGRTVAWSSTAPTVASVGATGEAVALEVGTTEIVAKVDEVEAMKPLRVWPQPVARVSVIPEAVSLPQFRKTTFRAIAYDRRGNVLADRAATWTTSDPAIFGFKANTDSLVARDVGSAVLTATVEGTTGESPVTVTNPVEARALWVTRFEYTTSSAVDFAKIGTIMQKAASANFNVVYFQVRTSGDALYFSDLEPCSPRMCGVLGGPRPTRDPLAVALAEAAKHGIEVHAWLNAYTGFISGSAAACNQFVNSTPANWLKANPGWSASTKNFTNGTITRQVDNCLTTPEYMWVSPGVPQVRAQLATVSADIARRYGPLGLKGIHLDRIRYSSNQVSYDPATQEAFRAATGAYPASNAQTTWLNFRRGLVNQGVKEVYDAVRAVDPALVLSAAVFPGYKREGAFAGWNAQWSHSDLFQDPQAWAQGGYLDVEVPMNYPATATSTSWTVKAYCSNTDWACVMDDHIRRIEGQSGRQVYVGVGAISGWTEMKKQIDLAHDRAITGMSVYSFSQVDAIPNGWAQLAAGPFKHKATLPAMSWKN